MIYANSKLLKIRVQNSHLIDIDVGDIAVLSLQFHANASFHDVTWANYSNYALQNPFTCVLNIMSNTPVLQYINPQNYSNAVFRILLKQVYNYGPVSRIFRGGGRTAA